MIEYLKNIFIKEKDDSLTNLKKQKADYNKLYAKVQDINNKSTKTIDEKYLEIIKEIQKTMLDPYLNIIYFSSFAMYEMDDENSNIINEPIYKIEIQPINNETHFPQEYNENIGEVWRTTLSEVISQSIENTENEIRTLLITLPEEIKKL